MPVKENDARDAARQRRRLTAEIKRSLRELSNQISLLNHRVGGRVDLRDVDLDCFDFISQHGPLGPSVLARRAGLHPATMTGILDRLEQGGWIVRERDPRDRRAVVVRALPERTGELIQLYAGMDSGMDDVCADFDQAGLALLADFLQRATSAGRDATEELA